MITYFKAEYEEDICLKSATKQTTIIYISLNLINIIQFFAFLRIVRQQNNKIPGSRKPLFTDAVRGGKSRTGRG